MIKVQLYITDYQKEAIEYLSHKRDISFSESLRRILDDYFEKEKNSFPAKIIGRDIKSDDGIPLSMLGIQVNS
jgi:hypothetical protein